MVTTASAREIFLRDRMARGIAIAGRLYDRRLLYAAYLVSGVATLIVCVGRPPSLVATTFLLYLAGLGAFFLIDRRRFSRALAHLSSVSTEIGPDPDPKATRSLPRYLLTTVDATDMPMLDAILVLTGDSMRASKDLVKSARRDGMAYRIAALWTFVGFVLLAAAIAGGLVTHTPFQVVLGEATLVLLAQVPPVVAWRDVVRYQISMQALTLKRVEEAEHALTRLDPPRRPYIDGNAVKYRDGKYIIDRSAFPTPVDDASIARRGKPLPWPGAEVFLGVGVGLSIIAFWLHPISGILVQ